MGSEDRAVKEKQLEKIVAQFEARKAALSSRGLDEKGMKKDPVLRNLEARVKKARGRIAAIEAAAKHVAEMKAKDTRMGAEKKAKGKKGQPQQGGKAKKPAAKGQKKKGK